MTIRHCLTMVSRRDAESNSLVRNQEKFMTLMDGYAEAMGYVEIAANSAGTSVNKFNNAYLNSIEASQAKFRSQFDSLSRSIWNSEFIKGTIDAGSGILGTFTKLSEVLGGIPVLLGVIGATVAGITNKGILNLSDNRDNLSGKGTTWFWNDIKNSAKPDIEAFQRIDRDIARGTGSIVAMEKEWSNLTQTGKNLAKQTHKTGESFAAASKSLTGLTIASRVAAVGMKILYVASNMLMYMAVAAALNGIIKVVSDLIVTQKEAVEKARESAEAYKELTEEISSMEKELETTAVRIDELNSKDNLTFVEQAELTKLTESNDELERQLRIKKELADIANKEAQKDAINVYNQKTERSTEKGSVAGSGIVVADKLIRTEYAKERLGEIDKIDQKILEQTELLKTANAEETISIGNTVDRLKKKKEDARAELGRVVDELLSLQNQLKGTTEGNELDALLIAYDKLIGADFTGHFNSVFDSDQFKNARREINELSKDGQLTADVLKTKYKSFVKELDKVGISAEDATSQINAMNTAGEEASLVPIGLEQAITDINSLSDGFEALDKIYADIKDKGTFDFSNLANSNFQNTFKSLGKDYTDFIYVISNSPKDIDKCKSAFNNLVTVWLDSKGILDNLNDETKNVTIAMLENMGVANAEEIVLQRLNQQKIAAALNTIDFTKSIGDQINVMHNELTTYGLTETAISKLTVAYANAQTAMGKAMAEGVANRMGLLKSELEGIKSTTDAYNLIFGKMNEANPSLSPERLYRSLQLEIKNGTEFGDQAEGILAYGKSIEDALKVVNNIKNSVVNYTGGVKTNKESKSKDTKDHWLEAFNKELATLKHQRAMDQISAEQYYTKLTQLRDKYFTSNGAVIEKYLSEYRQYTEEIYQGGTELFNARLKFSQDWIDDRNTYSDWDQYHYIGKDGESVQDDEIAAWDRVLQWMKTEYYEKGLINYETYLENARIITKKQLDLIQAEYESQLKDREDLLKKQQDALQDIIDLTVELIKKETQDKIDALNDEITRYSEIIALKRESLRLTERELSYQEEVDSKVTDISKLQAQADALGLDDSREAQAKRAELLEEIAKKQKELNKYQHDEAVNSAEEALDKQEDLFKKEKEAEIKELEAYLKKSGLLVQHAMQRIESDGDALYSKLLKYNLEYGSGINTEITSAWEEATRALKEYGSVLAAITSINTNLENIDKENSNPSPENMTPESRQNIINRMKENGDKWAGSNETERKLLHEKNLKLGTMIGAYYDASTGTWYTDKTKKEKLPIYHSGLAGGFVGGEYTPKQNEIYAILKKGELVMNEEDQFNVGSRLNLLDSIIPTIQTPKFIPPYIPSGENIAQNITVEVSAPIQVSGNVDDDTIAKLDQFRKRLKNDIVSDIQKGLNLKGSHSNGIGKVVKS